MGLARFLAIIFTKVLLRLDIAPLPKTLEQIETCSLQALQKMRAAVGQQSRASKMPPLVRTYKQRIKIKGPRSKLPKFSVLQRSRDDLVTLDKPLQCIPKGSRLISVEHVSSTLTWGLNSDETKKEPSAIGPNITMFMLVMAMVVMHFQTLMSMQVEFARGTGTV